MNKTAVTLIFLAISLFYVSARQVTLTYEDKSRSLPELMQQYFEMQGVQSMSVTMRGEFNGKRGKIKKVICSDGKFSEKEMLSDFLHFVLVDSMETLDFMAVPKDENKLLITCFYPELGNQLFCDTLDITRNNILMETYTAGNDSTIPIIAYTSGIQIDSEIGPMIWYCGLRDSGIDPRRWYEKHGIDNYVYYSISLEEDTPAGENDPVYIKMAKKDAGAFHRH